METRITEFELRGFAEAVLADVETTYWDFVLARRELEIYEESAALAERQLAATRDRIELGQLAAVELPAADAEVALRRQALINARGHVETLFFITLGKSGFADSFNQSLRTMDGDAYDARVGVRAKGRETEPHGSAAL